MRDGGAEFVETFAGVRGDGVNGAVFEGAAGEGVADEFERELGVFGDIDFCEGDDGAGHAEVGEDVEVLFGLRHPAIVGGDYDEGEVEGSDSGDHVVDEVGMAGDIDDADLQVLTLGAGEAEVSKAKLDSDSALLFFGQTVGVDSGQCLHEGGLSVVNVAGGSEDEVHEGLTVMESALGFKRDVERKRRIDDFLT